MTLQNVCIRVDASFDIGTGHVIRCLTLAKELQKKGCTVSVITRPFPGNLLKLIRDNGCDVYLLPEINEDSNMEEWNHHSRWLGVHWQTDAKQTIEILKTIGQIDILIVDHYAIDYQWEQVVRPYALKLMVIDDLADRIHACDLLLDQNYASNGSDRYARLVPEQCKTYLGPAYALLREEFRFQRALLQPRTGEKIKDIFLFFGGSDPTGQTLKLLEWMEEIEEVQETVDIHVIVGVSNPHKDQIEWRCTQTKNMHYYYNVTNISLIMARSDVAICSGGTITWERFCLGLPGLIITVAENQVEIARSTQRLGIDTYLGKCDQITKDQIKKQIKDVIKDPARIHAASQKAMRLVDGEGVQRVTEAIIETLKE